MGVNNNVKKKPFSEKALPNPAAPCFLFILRLNPPAPKDRKYCPFSYIPH